jgi:hypothetical protein
MSKENRSRRKKHHQEDRAEWVYVYDPVTKKSTHVMQDAPQIKISKKKSKRKRPKRKKRENVEISDELAYSGNEDEEGEEEYNEEKKPLIKSDDMVAITINDDDVVHPHKAKLDELKKWTPCELYITCKREEAQYLGMNPVKRLLVWFIKRTITEYTHTELVFKLRRGRRSSGRTKTYSFAAEYGKVLSQYENLDFTNGTWAVYLLHIDEQDIVDIYRWCIDQLDKPMNFRGLLFNFVPYVNRVLGCDGHNQSYFCSEFVMHALKYKYPEEFSEYAPHMVTPQQVMDIIASVSGFCSISTAFFDNEAQLRRLKLNY